MSKLNTQSIFPSIKSSLYWNYTFSIKHFYLLFKKWVNIFTCNFLISQPNNMDWHSLESSRRDDSNEWSHHRVWMWFNKVSFCGICCFRQIPQIMPPTGIHCLRKIHDYHACFFYNHVIMGCNSEGINPPKYSPVGIIYIVLLVAFPANSLQTPYGIFSNNWILK